ncbi:hypothetical protein O0L34_g6261 [Tuta absoluta]|nr:hypothetical protein O0L34_g6261 [Tuta absoluta]
MAGSGEDTTKKQCPTCMDVITTVESLVCTACNECYHVTFTSVSPQFFRIMTGKSKDRWICAHCRRGDKPKSVTTPKLDTTAKKNGKLKKVLEKVITPTDKVPLPKKALEKVVTPADGVSVKVPEKAVAPTDKSAGGKSPVPSIRNSLPDGMLEKIIAEVREDITHTFKNTIHTSTLIL